MQMMGESRHARGIQVDNQYPKAKRSDKDAAPSSHTQISADTANSAKIRVSYFTMLLFSAA